MIWTAVGHRVVRVFDLDLTAHQQAATVLVAGCVYAGRIPIHLRLKYLWPPSHSPKRGEQFRLNICFLLTVAITLSWIVCAYLLTDFWPTKSGIFFLCAILYYPVLFVGDAMSEAAVNADRRLGSDVIRRLRPIAWLVRRDNRASGGDALFAGSFTIVFGANPDKEGVSLASRFVIGCTLVLYVFAMVTFVPAAKASAANVRSAADRIGIHWFDASAKTKPPAKLPLKINLPPNPGEKAITAAEIAAGTENEYGSRCTHDPGDGGNAAVHAQLHMAVLGGSGRDGLGGNETGCMTVTIEEPNHPGVWLALGYCGQDLRGLVVVSPDWPAEAIIQQAAQIGKHFALWDELLGVSKRYDIGTGDMVVIATTEGPYLLIRPLLSKGQTAPSSRWCDAYVDQNVAYTTVPPGLIPLMTRLELSRRHAGEDFLWPADDTSEHPAGTDFTFHTGTSDSSIARATCSDAQHCALWYHEKPMNSPTSAKPTLRSILAAMPPTLPPRR